MGKTARITIVGGGFAGLQAARGLGGIAGAEVTLVDERNHHLFQPLLYQVAMGGLSAEQIAAPLRSLLSRYRNVRVLRARAERVELDSRRVHTDTGTLEFDYLVLACGAMYNYFGHEDWEPYAPGLKTVEQAMEIRRRVLAAFEKAELEPDGERRRALMTFVVVGAGPTGVELAGALGEMSRFTLARDFHNIDPKLARVLLIEAGPRILPTFPADLSSRAARDLESLGVQIWTSSPVTRITADGVELGSERIRSATALWAAGVRAPALNASLGLPLDPHGRVVVGGDLTPAGHPEVFVLGDQAHALDEAGRPLPGLAPVAVQQGRFAARQIRNDLGGLPRETFHYVDRGQLATIGRGRAVGLIGRWHIRGALAWLLWLGVHIYTLIGFRNRLIVLIQWAWAYLSYRSGARLIVERNWQSYDGSGR